MLWHWDERPDRDPDDHAAIAQEAEHERGESGDGIAFPAERADDRPTARTIPEGGGTSPPDTTVPAAGARVWNGSVPTS